MYSGCLTVALEGNLLVVGCKNWEGNKMKTFRYFVIFFFFFLPYYQVGSGSLKQSCLLKEKGNGRANLPNYLQRWNREIKRLLTQLTSLNLLNRNLLIFLKMLRLLLTNKIVPQE